MNLQPIFNLAQICHLKGIKHAVISPGSRNAALTIAFVRHPQIKCYSVPDERSAAFMALGISLKTGRPTALICTSGSAALNYAPAVAEAYFNQVPLLILSADRPPEWIGQRDGQTIYQDNLFGRHIKKSFIFPSLEEDQESNQRGQEIINEAINTSISEDKGPVHVNIPFREPFYPDETTIYEYSNGVELIEPMLPISENLDQSAVEISGYKKILLVVGQSAKDDSLNALLSNLSSQHDIPIVSDIISNANDVAGVITSQDVFLKELKDDRLKPDLLITVGLSVISKNLKIFLRNNRPKAHWHMRREENVPDTYLALTRHISSDAKDFLQALSAKFSKNESQAAFQKTWQEINNRTKTHIERYDSKFFSDFNSYKKVLDSLPVGIDLHLANSMAVRYANVIGLKPKQNIEVYCNRGTSGIDGSNSTAIGSALMTDKQVFLLTGDMAFLYDRNAFWHNHLTDNMHIVVFNNHGGGIFRMIDGPSKQPELQEFFETRQKKDAKLVAQEYEFEYYSSQSENELIQVLPKFMQKGKRKILEIFTDAEQSKVAFKELFRKLSD
ncbi:MAG: 2-succinyl-5-enolpyruvyl-6-hydroxy-3-cyclohexene-1-carboxylic-acid synthase [Reichenbachiella sp.]|uniref:2-succinyl-5-enolpyruvyl-6-hydroxy-3- cyclohexene-1-carboxylic-acid synthase n=1 Tax=Reichenbachiella sp. TaxID=2184521 RepID=UPI003267D387